MTEQGVVSKAESGSRKAETLIQGSELGTRNDERGTSTPSAGVTVHPIEEFNQRFHFKFSTPIEDHSADRRQMMVDYAREFGAPELSVRLERLFNPPAPAAVVANGFGLPAEVVECLESKFGSGS